MTCRHASTGSGNPGARHQDIGRTESTLAIGHRGGNRRRIGDVDLPGDGAGNPACRSFRLFSIDIP